MSAFTHAYDALNSQQRSAVDRIDGPVLVIAGPGTGKTQLLSARVANILAKTDTLPQNILCLTFTESGASNMRERLSRFVGQAAYDVNIGTYHAFGGDLIQRFPEYFGETRLQQPVDDLGKRQIVEAIVDRMSYLNPLKSTQYHLHDLISTLSEIKRGLLDEKDLRALALENNLFIAGASEHSRHIFEALAKMPGSYAKAAPYFEQLLAAIQPLVPKKPSHPTFGTLAAIAATDLQAALDEAHDATSTKPLTAWKNRWLEKNEHNDFIFQGRRENQRIEALAEVFVQYQSALTERGLYDFDDMILRSIQALENHADLRYTLQEQYLYLLLDEFQDTNAAQLKLIRLLTDNPLNEGRPNVMAVGDDDQAIYAFQGAQYSNMLDFFRMYREVFVVNLVENYRSHRDILAVAHNVAEQIQERLSGHFEDMSKTLAESRKVGKSESRSEAAADIDRHEFLSDIAQYDYIAGRIETLIQGGVAASEIAVLAPRHKQLEPLVAFLNQRGIAVRYEKRENILETPIVRQLLTMSKLVLALHANDHTTANALWPEVLSYDFWQLPTADIWRLSWQVQESRGATDWSQAMLELPAFRVVSLLFLNLAAKAASEPLELMLDYLIGSEGVETRDPQTPLAQSPLRIYYTDAANRQNDPASFYLTLSHLTVLRQKLRDHQNASEHMLTLPDLIRFVEMYEAAEERMINVSPYNQQTDAVQLMTVFKAKGLEFAHVFLPSCQDEVWGDSSRGNSNRLTLPANLAPIRHAGASADERLRIFFVAITRAKQGLHMTSYLTSYSGRPTKRLKYLDEREQADGSFRAQILPDYARSVQHEDQEVPSFETLELNWRSRHIRGLASGQLRDLLSERLEKYRLSASQLNTFTDMVHGGPETFLLKNLLRFPEASTPAAAYGTAIHATLQELQYRVDQGNPHDTAAMTAYFAETIQHAKLPSDEIGRLVERGRTALAAYLQARGDHFVAGNKAEYDFWPDNVMLDGDVRLSGKIDRLDIDSTHKTLIIVDYKTGKPASRWSASDEKLHKYQQQLYFYKLLVEHSHNWRGWSVAGGRLEFIEPDENGVIHTLDLRYDQQAETRMQALIHAIWQKIQTLDFPDTSGYDLNLAGTKAFEEALVEASRQYLVSSSKY